MLNDKNIADKLFQPAVELGEKKRIADKLHQPQEEFVQVVMGDDAWNRLMRFEELLKQRYNLNREMKYPFGKGYGWSFRYTHNKTLLLYVFFEVNGFCCTISINDKGAKKIETILNDLQPKIQDLWNNRHPCGDFGGWMHHSVKVDEELPDLIRLIGTKVKPKK